MLKILVVDDEELVRDDISYLLNNSTLDVEIVGEAANGRDALELVGNLQPDLVIVDVRMPVMNGIDLMRALKERYDGIKFIVLSGYADFSYAQDALKSGASDYLLKPIQDEKFMKAIMSVENQIYYENSVREKIDIANLLIKENKQFSLNNALCSLLSSKTISDRECEKLLDRFEVIKNKNYTIAVFRIGNHGSESSEELKFNVKNIIEKFVNVETVSYVFDDLNNSSEVILLSCGVDSNTSFNILKRCVEESHAIMSEYLRTPVTVGISDTSGNILDLPRLYGNSLASLKERFIKGVGGVFYYNGRNELSRGETIPVDKLNLLNTVLSSRDHTRIVEKAKIVLENLFCMETMEHFSLKKLKMLFAEIINLIVIFINKNKIDSTHLFDSCTISGDIMDKLDSCEDIVGCLCNLLDMSVKLEMSYDVDIKSMIREIRRYIEENYHEQISLNEIADRFGINPNYLSGKFKEETGVNFIDYLTCVRIEKAKFLLCETSLSINEISLNIGYNYQTYFQKVFKKIEGITPLDYRLLKKV